MSTPGATSASPGQLDLQAATDGGGKTAQRLPEHGPAPPAERSPSAAGTPGVSTDDPRAAVFDFVRGLDRRIAWFRYGRALYPAGRVGSSGRRVGG